MTVLLILMGIYLTCGVLFAIPFSLFGARKIDPRAFQSTWGSRLIIVPGVVALWPILIQRWLCGVREPPGENNAHRRLAGTVARRDTNSNIQTK